ncbi:WD40/YVTN/BNR-like repeat-containing protein [Aliidiomarina celeris]|uniref:WD40/YVTN/BNR-like repeat-containing protein n=1 Tax=Aliidiomarina celeris TaxID=2249428 RepID=UPI0013006A0F|nr:hypothetical protein [Aliidiomarina celeris]
MLSFLASAIATVTLAASAHASPSIEAELILPEGQWVSLSAPTEHIIWLGSNNGVVALSTDGGQNFELQTPAGASNHPVIRQISAQDDRHAYVLTSGRGELSRLYITRNAGFSWRRLYRGNGDEQLRCFAMIPDGEAWILADTLHDNWHVVRSSNGTHWISSRSGFSERPQHAEQASNDSQSCARFENDTWLMGTRNAEQARMIYKGRNSLRFQVENTPMAAGLNAGIEAVWPYSESEFLLAGGSSERAQLLHVRRNSDTPFTAVPLPATYSSALKLLLHSGNQVMIGNAEGFHTSEKPIENNEWNWQQIGNFGVQALSCYAEEACWALTHGGDQAGQTLVRIQF